MRFIDEARIVVRSGKGGPGCVAFHREKFVPRGGPSGGEGGRGGDITFVASDQLSTLQNFRHKRTFEAQNGRPGSGGNRSGRDGESVRIRIPVGTIIKDLATGEVIFDFTENGQEWVACEGGRGGKGNSHFATSTFQAPKFAQPGEEGKSLELHLELKLLADVGIIGFPNAGKSTLISAISAAKPKIADYAFTTLTPNLGVVALGEFDSFVVADIPGLVEGAHKGLGLGHKFLKHIERTKVFIHLLDGARLLEAVTRPDEETEEAVADLVKAYKAIREELRLYNEALAHKPEIVAINKLDLFEGGPEALERAREALRRELNSIRGEPPVRGEPFVISAVSKAGIQDLLGAVQARVLEARPKVDGRPGEERIQLPDGSSTTRKRAKPVTPAHDWSQTVAVFGGTFDPPHAGHREAVEGLLHEPGVARVIVLPAGTPPLKPGAGASPEDRLEMTRLCFSGFSRGEVEIDSSEIQLADKGPSYTYDSLVRLGARHRNLAFAVGADQLPSLGDWHRFPEILRLCDWVVLERKPEGGETARKALLDWERRGLVRPLLDAPGTWETTGAGPSGRPCRITLTPTQAREVSSSALRAALRVPGAESRVLSMLPAEVRAYIRKRSLYGHAGTPAP